MVGPDSFDSIGETHADPDPDSGWGLLARYDGAPALVNAVLDLDPARAYTKTELSEAAGVAYKTLYLAGTVEAFVDIGLLEKDDEDGEEATYSVDEESAIYETAAAFDRAVERRAQFESGRTNC